MNPLRITIIQTDIVWENKQENLRMLRNKLTTLSGTTEIVVLPEMFSTGFSMHSRELSEPLSGTTITTLKRWAAEFQMAITGSYIADDNGKYFNRAFFLTPQGEEHYYDKRHLFRMGHETEHFSAGNERLVFPYLGWNICLMVCYDLRFPVWSRNINNEYDLLIYVASWPTPRKHAWSTLLCARAIENQSYVCGVNRTGTDFYGITYPGCSALYNAKGEKLSGISSDEETTQTLTLDRESLYTFREKFPTWKDADIFNISE